jgi:hypothetical protein
MSSGGANDNQAAIQPQQNQQQQQQQHHHHQQTKMDIRSVGSSPPMVSTAGGAMDPMGGMFATGEFDGINPHMFSSALMPSDMDFGPMDWNSISAWGGPFGMADGTFGQFSHPGMMPGPGPGPR